MSADTYLIIILVSLTAGLISMQPLVWIAWGMVLIVACVRFGWHVLRLIRG